MKASVSALAPAAGVVTLAVAMYAASRPLAPPREAPAPSAPLTPRAPLSPRGSVNALSLYAPAPAAVPSRVWLPPRPPRPPRDEPPHDPEIVGPAADEGYRARLSPNPINHCVAVGARLGGDYAACIAVALDGGRAHTLAEMEYAVSVNQHLGRVYAERDAIRRYLDAYPDGASAGAFRARLREIPLK